MSDPSFDPTTPVEPAGASPDTPADPTLVEPTLVEPTLVEPTVPVEPQTSPSPWAPYGGAPQPTPPSQWNQPPQQQQPQWNQPQPPQWNQLQPPQWNPQQPQGSQPSTPQWNQPQQQQPWAPQPPQQQWNQQQWNQQQWNQQQWTPPGQAPGQPPGPQWGQADAQKQRNKKIIAWVVGGSVVLLLFVGAVVAALNPFRTSTQGTLVANTFTPPFTIPATTIYTGPPTTQSQSQLAARKIRLTTFLNGFGLYGADELAASNCITKMSPDFAEAELDSYPVTVSNVLARGLYRCIPAQLDDGSNIYATGLQQKDRPCAGAAFLLSLSSLPQDRFDEVREINNSVLYPADVREKLVADILLACPDIGPVVADRVVNEELPTTTIP